MRCYDEILLLQSVQVESINKVEPYEVLSYEIERHRVEPFLLLPQIGAHSDEIQK
jgi:hypothetical protein